MKTPLTPDDVNSPPEYEVKWRAGTDWNRVRELEDAAKNGDLKAFEELSSILNAAVEKVDL